MRPRLLVAGTGKMGRNIGAFFLRRGYRVDWASRDGARLEALQDHVARLRRRWRAAGDGADGGPEAGFLLAEGGRLPEADIAIEAIDESLPSKRRLLAELAPRLPERAPLASASSSILPWEIHPRCLGVHFFYPLELAGLAELVAAPGQPGREAALSWLREAGIAVIEQTERQAFAVNRLLLPCQVECLRALVDGMGAPEVQAASASPLLPGGLLAPMDAVGLDVVEAAARNYAGRLPEHDRPDYAPLWEGLALLLAQGKRGAKNRDGLLVGRPLRWAPAGPDEPARAAQLHTRLQSLLIHTCRLFLRAGQIGPDDLRLVCRSLWGAEGGLDALRAREARDEVAAAMAALHEATGLSYFAP